MNWYFEKEGVSQGPLPGAELAARVQRQELHADSLVWHPGLENWGSIRQLQPEWLESTGKPTIAAQAVFRHVDAKQPSTTEAAATPSAPAAARPKAGMDEPADGKTEGGLLSRLFGFMKKKK